MNKDYNRREQILFDEPYNKDHYMCGCRRFECSFSKMKQLIEEGFIDPYEAQNDSPTTEEFMEYAENFKDVYFECYAISPDRDDYRITIEGIDINIPADEHDLVAMAVQFFRYADEFSFDYYGGFYTLHAWWD